MGTEGIQDKYINPYADFGFKLLFGTAMNKELFEAAEIAKFNPKELGEYWESLKNFRDWYSVMSTQLKKVLSKVVRKNASSISETMIYSSAVCEREDFPGPILTDGNFINA